MEKDGSWHITPAYDMTFTTNLDGAPYENMHSMSVILLCKKCFVYMCDSWTEKD